MSLLAGFDIVAEISRRTLARLLQQNLQLAGRPMSTPFEITLPLSTGMITGKVHVIVTAVDVTLGSDDSITLVLDFARSSVLASAGTLVFDPMTGLAGQILITAPLVVASPSWSTRAIAVDLSMATVRLNAAFSEALTILKTPAQAAIQAVVRAAGRRLISPEMQVVGRSFTDGTPAGNGRLSDGVFKTTQFVSLEIHRIDPDTVGIFGILLAANDGAGDHTRKIESSLRAGHDVSVSLSPAAFHSLVFCPKLSAYLQVPTASLPTSCGSGEASLGGVTITALTDHFSEGHIDVDVSLKKSGDCPIGTWELDASLHTEVGLSVHSGALIPAVSASPVQVDLHPSFWCTVALALATGPVGFVALDLVESLVEDAANALIGQTLSGSGASTTPTGLNLLPGTSIDTVYVTEEGLTVQGTMAILLPVPDVPALELMGSVTTNSKVVASNGVYKPANHCMRGDYRYTENLQLQTYTCRAVTTLLETPLKLKWSVQGAEGPPVTLSGSEGTVSVNVKSHYRLPLPVGISIDATVTIKYAIEADTGIVRLNNVAEDGIYYVSLRVLGTEPDGAAHTSQASVLFEGEGVDLEDGYNERAMACLLGPLITPYPEISWPPIDHPAPDDFLKVVRALTISNEPGSGELLAETKVAHGSAFYTAVLPIEAANEFLPELG